MRDIWLAIGLWVMLLVCLTLLYTAFGALSGSVWHLDVEFIDHATDISRLPGADAIAWLLILVRVFLLAGLGEELLFRGILFGWIKQRTSANIAILVTTVLFTIEHYYLVIFPLAFFFGLVAGWLRERTDSILPGLVMHILGDGTLLLIAYIMTLHHLGA
jgi:uncharacterized protein